MQHFHFQVRTGTHVMMIEVSDLSDSDEARVEAAKRIGLLLHAHAGKLWADEGWQMDVTDDDRANPFRHKYLRYEKLGDLHQATREIRPLSCGLIFACVV